MLAWLLLAAAAQAPASPAVQPPSPPPTAAENPKPARVGTMSELMIKIIYPTSDAVFYITTRTPKDDADWNELQAKTLMLAESANLLMLPIHARDQDRWMRMQADARRRDGA